MAEILAPRALRLEGLVNGVNKRVPGEALTQEYAAARKAYEAAGAKERLVLESEEGTASRRAAWLLAQLKGK